MCLSVFLIYVLQLELCAWFNLSAKGQITLNHKCDTGLYTVMHTKYIIQGPEHKLGEMNKSITCQTNRVKIFCSKI